MPRHARGRRGTDLMARYEVAFTRDVIQIGTLLVEAESPEDALAKTKRFSPHDVAGAVSWQDDTAGPPYAVAVMDQTTGATNG